MTRLTGRAYGRWSRKRGRAAEERVYARMDDVVASVEWLTAWRRSTPEEDARGIDAVATSDVGELHLQVKASGRNASRAVYVERGIGVIVANEHYSDWRIEADIRETLSGLRARRLAATELAAKAGT